MVCRFLFIVAVLLLPGSVFAQAPAADTTRSNDSTDVVTDTTAIDSLSTDTLAVDSVAVDTAEADSLTRVEIAQRRFEERLAEQQKRLEAEAARRPFSYQDSLTVHFLSQKTNLRPFINQSCYHDAGHFYKFHPGYFRVEWVETPMRHTVQPFGLVGDRLAVLQDGNLTDPFEHMLEPNGTMDMNDLPTAMDDAVYALPGPAGVVFGGDRGVATLLTQPPSAEDNDAHSAFLVDKGTFGYSYARARYARQFQDGRDLQFALGYRNTDGPDLFGSDDDAYHWLADFYFPVGDRAGLQAGGRLYRREGSISIQNTQLDRDKFDREGRLALHWLSADESIRTKVAYRHRRSSANLFRAYVLKLNQTSNGVHLSREWSAGGLLLKVVGGSEYEEFDYGTGGSDRVTADASVSAATVGDGVRFAARVGSVWHKDFEFMPQAALLAHYENDHWLINLSGGYVERIPSQLELELPAKTALIYQSLPQTYADRGNPDLQTEKQVTGAAELALTGDHIGLWLEITGGRILDGIDWVSELASVDGSTVRLWSPKNGDLDYVSGTIMPRLRIADFLRLHAGASYRYTDYELFVDRPYTPEYQLFAGGELHYFWRQRLIHFYAYGEMMFDGPYDGWYVSNLGEEAVFNGKLSIEMGRFRFNFTFKNVFAELYEDRETNLHGGRTTSYGFVWHFLN